MANESKTKIFHNSRNYFTNFRKRTKFEYWANDFYTFGRVTNIFSKPSISSFKGLPNNTGYCFNYRKDIAVITKDENTLIIARQNPGEQIAEGEVCVHVSNFIEEPGNYLPEIIKVTYVDLEGNVVEFGVQIFVSIAGALSTVLRSSHSCKICCTKPGSRRTCMRTCSSATLSTFSFCFLDSPRLM